MTLFQTFIPIVDEENLVHYCRTAANDSMRKYRPYFIFTSRNKECLPNVQSIYLDLLTKKDAVALIQNELIESVHTKKDAEELAETLQYFPLDIQQAIAYIKEHDRRKRIFNLRYDIRDYLKQIKAGKTVELLSHQYSDDFGKHGRTTFNITLDAIKADTMYGENAIQVLKILAYLYADKIEPKMFLSLFENDSTSTTEAFLLLEKYSMITRIENHGVTYFQIQRLVQTATQLTFQDEIVETIDTAMKLINPELYELYFDPKKNKIFEKRMNESTRDQLLQYRSLSRHIKKNQRMLQKYSRFLDSVMFTVVTESDIETDDDERVLC